jgi:hypothetical protein
MDEPDDYDVVVDTLQQHYDKLWKMTQSNMNMDMFNIMDQIRLDQMDQLKTAIQLWKTHCNV